MLIVISLILVICQCSLSFQEFCKIHNKNYSDQQFSARRMTYDKNILNFQSLNSLNRSYKLGPGFYADWTDEEIENKIINNVLINSKLPKTRKTQIPTRLLTAQVPSKIDWRTQNGVTPVKNQLSCSACWAFSTAALAESFLLIKTGQSYDLSEQYLLQCSNSTTCSSGDIESTLNQLMLNKGLPSQLEYPYKGDLLITDNYQILTPGICQTNNFINIPENSVLNQYQNVTLDDIKALVKNGPLAVHMYINKDFVNYQSGIFECSYLPSQTQLNHYVVIIGYDENEYLIAKNSFGSSWGESGFVNLNSTLNCGVFYSVYQLELAEYCLYFVTILLIILINA